MSDPFPPQALDDIVRLGTGEGRDLHFRALFDAYSPRLRRFFRRHGRTPTEVEDLTQEVWVRVLRDKKAFSSTLEFEPWLMTIAGNLYRNDLRARMAAKRAAPEVPIDHLEEGAVPVLGDGAGPAAVDSPLGAVLDRERRIQVSAALTELPDKMRRCFQLRYDGGFKYHEIAALLDISIETVKAHLYQARRKLKARLSPFADAAPEEDPH